jgi:toxin ParE1/3/4
LLEIWLFIAEDSPVNADRYIDKLNEKAQKVARFNEMGVDRPELGKDIQSFIVDRYVLFYRPLVNGIELVRVLNASRDLSLVF